MSAKLLLLVAAALMVLVANTSAHPIFWTVLNTSNCTALPTTGMGVHSKPVTDVQTKLVLQKKGQAVAKICPGLAHTVLATFPDKREWVMVSNKGAFTGSTGACPNRATSTTNMPVGAVNITLTLPCSVNTGTVQLTLLSVSSSGNKTFQAVAAVLPVTAASTCPASTCNAATTVTSGGGASAAAGSTGASPAASISGAVDLGNLLPTLFNGATANGTFTLDPASVITVLKNLGSIMKNNSALQPQNIVNFLQSVGTMIQPVGSGSSSGSSTAASATTPTDVPGAVFALLKALGAAIPIAGSPPDLNNLMSFIKAVGNLLTLLGKSA